MAGKITDYPSMTTLASGDLMDVSDSDGLGGFTSKSLDWDDLKTNIEGQITFANIYSNDGTLAGNRIVSMLANDLTFLSTIDANLLKLETTFGRVGIGIAAPSVKLEVAGDSKINGTFKTQSASAIPVNLYKEGVGNNMIQLSMQNDAAAEYQYAQIGGKIMDDTAGSEEGSFLVQLSNNGTLDSFGEHQFLVNGLTRFPQSINGGIFRESNSGGFRWSLNLRNSANAIEPYAALATEVIDNTNGSEDGVLKFYARSNGVNFNSSNHQAILTGTGFGIGTATPTEKLEVVGNAYINGRLGVNAPPFGNAASYLISISGDLYGKRILADNLAANGYGLYVRSTSPTNNFGIFGKSTTTGSGSESSGVEGISDGTNGTNHYGVRGRGKNGSSLSFGGYFQIEGGASIVAANRTSAVYGLNQSTNSGQNIAIQGISLSTSGISYGLKAEATGAATTNYGGYFRATTATNNYAIIVPSGGGNVGIGTVTPTESLEVAGKVLITQTDGLQLNQLNGRITIGNTISSTTHFLLRGTRPTLIDLGDATTSRFSVGANAQTIINYTSATGTIFRINRISENFAFTVRGDDGNVGIGVGSAPSRKLHVAGGLKLDSTTEALQVMRMTTTQRDALTAATGDIVYNTTTSKHQGYNGSVWNDLY